MLLSRRHKKERLIFGQTLWLVKHFYNAVIGFYNMTILLTIHNSVVATFDRLLPSCFSIWLSAYKWYFSHKFNLWPYWSVQRIYFFVFLMHFCICSFVIFGGSFLRFPKMKTLDLLIANFLWLYCHLCPVSGAMLLIVRIWKFLQSASPLFVCSYYNIRLNRKTK